MPPPPAPPRLTTSTMLFALLVLSASACASTGERTALALASPDRIGPTVLRVEVECSDAVEVWVEDGAGVEGVPLVTVWGRPEPGRCRVPVRVELPAVTGSIEDGATGMVVELPAPPPAAP